MKLKNKIFAILTIFCLIASACAVSAANETNSTYMDGMYNGYPTEIHETHNATDNSSDLDAEAIHDSMVLPPDYAHSEMNATNGTGHAASENVTATNTTNATQTHTMPATGNPILALLAVGAIFGGAEVYRRRK